MVENKIKVAARLVFIADQKVRENLITVTIPLCEYLRKKRCGKEITDTTTENTHAEFLCRQCDTVKLILWFKTEMLVRLERRFNVKAASFPVEEITEIHTKFAGNPPTKIGKT